MTKHKHKWHFAEFKDLQASGYGFFMGRWEKHAIFVCECGVVKKVKIW